MSAIKYLAGDGKTEIEIRVERKGNAVTLTTFVGGKYDWSAHDLAAVAKNCPVPGAVASIGRVALKQDRVDQVRAIITQIQSEIDADPVAQMQKLIAERNKLSRNLSYILDAAHEDHVNRVEHMSAHGFAHASKRDFEAEEKSARAALAAFDAAHPDTVAKIKADAEAEIERFLSTN